MTIKELLPELRDLPRADKIRLIQFLAAELAKEEGLSLLQVEETYAVWPSFDGCEPANALLELPVVDSWPTST
ncbi:MAG: hypothetical protein H6633_33240 [Anaerolineales bacterium]|nr:hypothetical protein [Anaerolineales bacterium]